jgi:uncharacterized phage protein (TIGR02218 family)
MKTLPSGLATMAAQRTTTWATALKITRPDATVYGFTSADRDATISSVLYKANPGLDATSIALSAGLNVDNLELTTLDDGTVFTKADVLGRRWHNSAFVLFRYNWANVADGIDTLLAGVVGEVELRRNTVWAELRGLQQYLQQPVGQASSKTCRNRLGVNNGRDSICTVTLASYTVTGSVTSVVSNQVFTDSTRAEAAGYFDEGLLTWTSGPNNGLVSRVKTFTAGAFTLALPMLGTVAVGHTYSVVAGCRKRLAEDCIAKFNQVLQFNGEPHRPKINDLIKTVEPSA